LKKLLAISAAATLVFFGVRPVFCGWFSLKPKSTLQLSLLHRVAKRGHGKMARMLLAMGVFNVNAKSECLQWTPLHMAVIWDRKEMVKLFLADKRVEVNARDSRGCTPLWEAVAGGYEEVVKLLLADGHVDVNLVSNFKNGPLSVATQFGHCGVIKMLLADGRVDVDARNCEQQTLLQRGSCEECFDLSGYRVGMRALMEGGADFGGSRRVLKNQLPVEGPKDDLLLEFKANWDGAW